MSRLWLVRHGPTHAKTMIGWTDRAADLSDDAALGRLSAALPETAQVISSDLSRAVATADRIGGERSRRAHRDGLREIHFGDWEDRSFAEIDAEAPDQIRAFWEVPGAVRAPGGESWDDLAARVTAAVDEEMAQEAEDLVVVCHFGAILTQVQRALDLSAQAAFRMKIDPLSVTLLEQHGSDWSVGFVNRLP
ncbi:histidine phosphatase family protein [Aestuariibius insulae]|uniref:histidine phosphatase family protein n=1 Tax=Aestuariibius insulae TaxID=2058287 RepID=UPI00345E23FD